MKVNNTIVVSVGQAGNQIAASFWKTICQEHGLDPLTGHCMDGATPRGNWNSFFSRLGEGNSGGCVPRAVMCDLEPSVIEEVRAKSGFLFNPASLLHRTEGAGGNFAVGHMGEGRDLLPDVMARINALHLSVAALNSIRRRNDRSGNDLGRIGRGADVRWRVAGIRGCRGRHLVLIARKCLASDHPQNSRDRRGPSLRRPLRHDGTL